MVILVLVNSMEFISLVLSSLEEAEEDGPWEYRLRFLSEGSGD